MTTRDWGGLGAIVEEARALDEELANRPLIDCPRCGDILTVNAAGEKSCPMGHFRTYEPTRNWANGGM